MRIPPSVDKLVKLIQKILYRLRRFALRGRYPSSKRKATEIRPIEEPLIWIDSGEPESTDSKFNPALHIALPTLQRKAAEDLFRHFGLKWIPAQFWELLEINPDPTHAFKMSCFNFGLPTESLRTSHPLAIELLHQCVGMLLDLGEIQDILPKINHHQIVRIMQERDYVLAEDMLETFKLISQVLRESELLLKEVSFAEYRVFVREMSTLKDFSALSKEAARETMRINEEYRELHTEFTALVISLDDLIDWLQEHWPANAWGEAHLSTAQGIMTIYEELLDKIKSDDKTSPFDAMDRLIGIKGDLLAFIENVRVASGSEWHERSYGGTLEERLKAWYWALRILEFLENANPDEAEIRKKTRELRFEHHADRWAWARDTQPDLCIEHEEAYHLVNKADEILRKGKPE